MLLNPNNMRIYREPLGDCTICRYSLFGFDYRPPGIFSVRIECCRYPETVFVSGIGCGEYNPAENTAQKYSEYEAAKESAQELTEMSR